MKTNLQAKTKPNQTLRTNLMQPMNPVLRNFRYQKLPVRVVTMDGEAWFVAKDVCDVLELQNSRSSLALLDDDEKGVHTVDTLGGSQEMSIVSEPGLYALILRSRKPEAKLFKRWITHEVIPSIRKTGKYAEPTVIATEVGGLTVWNVMQLALQEKTKNEELQNEVAELTPKGQLYDRIIDSPSSFSLGETAKMLGYCQFGQNNLIKFLRYEGILMANNVVKQRYIDRGYFVLVQREYATLDGLARFYPVTRVLEKGIDFILRRIKARTDRLALEMPALATPGVTHKTSEARENYRAALTRHVSRGIQSHP